MKNIKKTQSNQKIYLFTGIILTGMGIYLNYNDLINGGFPEALMLIPLGLFNLMLAYLSPHLFPRDERAKEIMGKSMMANYYVLFGTIFVLFLLTGSLGPITLNLDATQVLIVLFSVMALTIPGTMVIYSKRV